MNTFSTLGLSEALIETIHQLGFEQPTPVQEKSIPILLENDPTDFIGLAQTGTGKTAAFGLPLIDLVDVNKNATQALIMSPTRELSQQIATQLESFSKNNQKLNIEVVYGGANIVPQMKALKKPTQIIVATPGRLLDLIKRKTVKLDQVQYVVLDEADEMLNMGFQEAIDEILSHTQEFRVTWLFSATMPSQIRRIVKKYMQSPLEVSVNATEKSNKNIKHQYVITKVANKVPAIKRFLDSQPDMRGIMFCRTKRETQEVSDELVNHGYASEALHGDLSQSQRDAVMNRFKKRSMQLLVATDVAARGIDVNDLSHVFHHTLPDQLESYTHRSGRTGRAGNKGISLAFINPREGRKIKDLEHKIHVTFERTFVPNLSELQSIRANHWVKQLMDINISTEAEDLYEEMKEHFSDVSKEELLKKLLNAQLKDGIDAKEEENLNETVGGAPDRRDNANFNKYFINIGSVDGFTKSDMLGMLSDISNVDKKFFGSIRILKTRSFFEVDKQVDKNFSNKFKGVELDDRAVKVNLDNDPNPRTEQRKARNTGNGRKDRKTSHRNGKSKRKRSR